MFCTTRLCISQVQLTGEWLHAKGCRYAHRSMWSRRCSWTFMFTYATIIALGSKSFMKSLHQNPIAPRISQLGYSWLLQCCTAIVIGNLALLPIVQLFFNNMRVELPLHAVSAVMLKAFCWVSTL